MVRTAEARLGRRIVIVQDCAHAFGARWQGRRVCTAGDVALFGLNVSKMMTSIFGGMLTTDDDDLAGTIRSYRNAHFRQPGVAKALTRRLYLLAVYAAFSRPIYGLVYWLQMKSTLLDRFTKAYHLDDEIRLPPDHLDCMLPVEASVGISQLAKYDVIEERRREAARRYHELLEGHIDGVLPPLKDGATYSHYVVRTRNRQALMCALAEDGIELGQLIEYSMPELAGYRGYADSQSFPLSSECSRSTINLPISASMADHDQRRIARSFIAASRSVL
jgi:dTDP-4-amino-4,6-dideoxygalactose transaminase